MAILTRDSQAVADKDGPAIGDVAPPFTLAKTIQGPPAAELTWDKLKGKVVVLEFWATWCGPCLKAIPHLNDLVDQFTNRPVVFISVTSENEDVVRLFLKKRPVKAWIGLDDYDVLNKLFHVDGIPHAVIVDAGGHIAAIAHPKDITAENLEEILAGQKCSLPPPTVYTVVKSPEEVVSNEAPALFEVSIREHKMPPKITGPICIWSPLPDHCGFSGRMATVESALEFVFDKTSSRMEIHGRLPEGYYDFELRAPLDRTTDLPNQFGAALRTTFGLEVRLVPKITDVYVLTQISTNAPGLRATGTQGGGGTMAGGFRSRGCDTKQVAENLEMALGKPVFDETGLPGFFEVEMKWKLSAAEELLHSVDRRVRQTIDTNPGGDWISTLPKELREGAALEQDLRLKAELAKPYSQQFLPEPDAVIAAARERLGLQLTPTQRPVEILEVGSVTPAPLP